MQFMSNAKVAFMVRMLMLGVQTIGMKKQMNGKGQQLEHRVASSPIGIQKQYLK